METNNSADQTAVTSAYAIKNQQLAVPGYRFTVSDPSHYFPSFRFALAFALRTCFSIRVPACVYQGLDGPNHAPS
jgi:hypothetical protein